MPERRQSHPKKAALFARHLALAALIPLVLYARTTSFDYVHADDVDLIAGNQTFLRDLGNAPRAFGRSYFETEAESTDLETYYRPVTIVSFMLDAQWGGADPRAYHVTNVVLHAGVSVLLLLLATTWGASSGAAIAAAAVFAAHPVNVQAVAWIAGRNELLLAVFGLLSLVAWSRAGRAGGSHTAWIGVHVFAFALALLSKETGVVIPALAVLHQRLTLGSWVSRAHSVALGLDVIVLLVWASLRGQALAGSVMPSPADLMSLMVVNSPQLLVQAGKLLAPVRLNVSPSVDPTGIAIGVLAVAALVVIAIRFLPRGLAILAACWWLVFLLPTLVVPGLPAYEHRNYLPLLGVVLTFVALRPGSETPRPLRVGRKPHQKAPGRSYPEAMRAGAGPFSLVAVALVVAIFSIETYARQEVYRDALAYWTDATRDARFAPFAHINLGRLYEGAGRLQDARQQYLRALEIDPATPKGHNNLGVVLMKLNEPQVAMSHFEEEARRHPSNAEAWFNLGLAAERRGDAAEARRHYKRAVSENKSFLPAHEKLGTAPPRK